MKNYTRVFAGLVALLMTASSTGLYAVSADGNVKTVGTLVASDEDKTSESKEDTKAAVKSVSNGFKKDETVYVITDANGNPTKKVVTAHLLNPEGKAQIPDVSDLTDIENTKNDDDYSGSGSSMTWKAKGE
ncbi:MAG: hypothetical protein IJ723_00290, partial [Ruminococcus sp.]|nr:hypothetical protein [Ruminococcus sp.]